MWSRSACAPPEFSLADLRRRRGLTLAAALFAIFLLSLGCASDCDDADCAAGNRCLPYNGETKCRKICASNADPATSCPFGYTCVAQPSAAFCVKDTPTLKAGTKLWGARCAPTGGLEQNPDCDSAQGFLCYGTDPSDGAAYCTRYGCTSDRDCAAGFYCGDINVQPNVLTRQRTIGETEKVCLKRGYCAPCTADLDCPLQNGVAQHCVLDDDNRGFCTPECTSNQNCQEDADCVTGPRDFPVCFPRAARCTGDGTLCSPCRSDADCAEGGACVKPELSREKFCTAPSKIPCRSGGTQGTDFDCPAPTGGPAGVRVRCLSTVFPDVLPANHCHGVYATRQDSIDVGCWTRDR